MNTAKKLRLGFAIIMVGLACFGMVLYQSVAMAQVGARSVSLDIPSAHAINQLDGHVTEQLVRVGERVTQGQPLYTLRNNQLAILAASGVDVRRTAAIAVATDGTFTVTAPVDGTMQRTDATVGSFVAAGSRLATVAEVDQAYLRADFEMSGPQYARLTEQSRIHVSHNGRAVHATIKDIDRRTANGHTATTIRAVMAELSPNEIQAMKSNPLTMHVVLDETPLAHQVRSRAGAVLDRL